VDTGDWIERWLSEPRFRPYLDDADGDRAAALGYYAWNARVASSFHHDLGHLEVALRNAYDRALTARDRPGDNHWVYDSERHFPVQMRRGKRGPYDANGKTRMIIDRAIGEAASNSGTRHPDPGKVIAELNFGFWRNLTTARLDRLWRTHLHRAFPAGTLRADVQQVIDRLHTLRNRVAHHEPLLNANLPARYRDILTVAGMLSGPFRDHLNDRSVTLDLIEQRPTG